MEVVDYFTRAFQLFRTLDTYTALTQADIAPTDDKLYSLSSVQETLEEYSGGRVILRCRGPKSDILHEAWYVYFVKGSLQSGIFIPAKDLGENGDKGNCAESVHYLPKKCPGNNCGRVGEL
jgi:ribonuclease T2